MCLLGIDLGTKRIGVAVSDEFGWTAQALSVILRHGGKRDLDAIARLIKEHEITAVVVGLPLNMDGTEGRLAKLARRFATRLHEHLGIPVHLWDERLTTWEAEGILRDAQVKPKKRRQVVDKLAASLILKSYLQAHNQPQQDQETPA